MAKSLKICEYHGEFQRLTSHYFFLSFFVSCKKKYPVENFRKNEDGSYGMHWCYCVLLSSYINHAIIFYCLLTLNWTDIFDVVALWILYFYLPNIVVELSLCHFGTCSYDFTHKPVLLTQILFFILFYLFIYLFFSYLLNQKARKTNSPTTNILYLTLHPPLWKIVYNSKNMSLQCQWARPTNFWSTSLEAK